MSELIKYRGAVYRLAGKLPKLYHGTSRKALESIQAGRQDVAPAFTEHNVSLGGTYFTVDLSLARVYAHNAARAAGEPGDGVVLLVDPIYPLYPDEDWVVDAIERKLPLNENGEIKDRRYREFFGDLFHDYLGEGHSLSDHYAAQYYELNRWHNITWRDSLKWHGSVRQEQPLTAEQIKKVL